MNFELSDEQGFLQEVSRSMLTANCPPKLVRALADSGDDCDDRLWQRGAELGWPGLAASEAAGGAEQGLVELTLVAEELGRAVAPGPFIDSALAAHCLDRVESAVAADLLPRVVSGQLRVAWAHHGSVTARESGDSLVLDGHLSLVASAASSDWLLVTVTRAGGSVLVLVDTARSEIRTRKTIDETRRWYDVVFAELTVPLANVVTEDAVALQWYRDAASVLIAADALGVGERLLEMTVDYTKIREQFGRPIGSFQAVKHKAADMLTTVKGARAATYYAAMALDAGAPDASLAASVAKAYVGEGISALAGEALQTHGGIGFTWEHDLHLFLRRAKADELVLGPPAEHYERIVLLLEAKK